MVCGRPVQRRGEPRAAVQLARVASAGVPGVSGRAQVAMQAAPLRVLLQPAAEPWPFPQQRLVRDLDLAVADRDQPVVTSAESTSPRRSSRITSSSASETRRRTTADPSASAAREPQQDPARYRALPGIELLVGGLGQPGHRAVHTAGVLVGAHAQEPTIPVEPELEQRGRQQRQRARLALHVRDQRVDELGLNPQPGAAGRQLDRAAKLVRGASDRRARGLR